MSRSGYCGRRKRIDQNQRDIADALRAAGVSVCIISSAGDGIPDLLVSTHERTWLIEVKGPKGTLTEDQARFAATWRGEIQLVRSIEDALRTIRARK